MLSHSKIYEVVGNKDSLWQKCLSADFLTLPTPLMPDRATPAASYREAWLAWKQSFSAYAAQDIQLILKAWETLETWAEEHIPAVMESLRPGASEEELDDAEEKLGVEFPPALRLIYRIHDGQDLLVDRLRDAHR
ncbi:unnamed protein product, partial [Heterosigma akashiwo]